ncbi:MAG: hypothetical protein ACLU5K_00880 [Christensenellales bacterium]
MEGYTHFSDRPSEAHMNGEQEEKVFDVGDSVFYPCMGWYRGNVRRICLAKGPYILRFITSATAMVPR